MRDSASSASVSAGRILADVLPAALRAPDVVERALGQRRQAAQVGRLLRRVGDRAVDLHVQHARQVGVLPQRPVDSVERFQRAGVVGIEADDLFPARGGARRILERTLVDLGDAPHQLDLLVGVGGVLGVLLQHLHQLARVARALEDPLEARQRVAVAGDRLQDLGGGPLPLRQVRSRSS